MATRDAEKVDEADFLPMPVKVEITDDEYSEEINDINSSETSGKTDGEVQSGSSGQQQHSIGKAEAPMIFQCYVCLEMFSQRATLQKHMSTHGDLNIMGIADKMYQCGICSAQFTRVGHLERHSAAHGSGAFQCPQCKEKFDFPLTLKRHFQANPSHNPNRCDKCNRVFKSSSQLKQHKKVHVRDGESYVCSHCGKEFTNKKNLTRHVMIHNSAPNFRCSICSRVFVRKSHMQRHEIAHGKSKSYECPICLKNFVLGRDFNTHVANHNVVERFRCMLCSAEIVGRENLNEHIMETHDDVETFTCSICLKNFGNKKNFRCHISMHASDKIYKCPDCGKEFRRRDYLRSHVVVHKSDRVLQCPLCWKTFVLQASLEKHLKKHEESREGIVDIDCDDGEESIETRPDNTQGSSKEQSGDIVPLQQGETFDDEVEVKVDCDISD